MATKVVTTPATSANFVAVTVNLTLHAEKYSWNGARGSGQYELTLPTAAMEAVDINKLVLGILPAIRAEAEAEFQAMKARELADAARAQTDALVEAASASA